MSSDLKINGEAYMPRRQSGVWGTFYTTVIPPISGSNTGYLETTWGSRMAEMSGRVRGVAGLGTLLPEGTLIIDFMPNYFSEIPVVNLFQRHVGYIPETYNWAEDANYGVVTDQDFTVPCPTFIQRFALAKHPGNPDSDVWSDVLALSWGYHIRDLTNVGFSICHNPEFFGTTLLGVNPGGMEYIGRQATNVIYWHAFGV